MEKTQTEEKLIREVLNTPEALLPMELREACRYVREERLNALPKDAVTPLMHLLVERKQAAKRYQQACAALIEQANGGLDGGALESMLKELAATPDWAGKF